MKLLVWLLLGLLVYWALRSQIKRNQQRRNPTRSGSARDSSARGSAPSSAQPSPNSSTPIENMVACSYCQIYLPASEAIRLVTASTEHYYCSTEHAELHAKNLSK